MGEIKNITVVGSGIMGTGIAHSIFKYGYNVTLYDINKDDLARAVSSIRSKARRNMDPSKVRGESDINKALDHCDLVIEAVFEDLAVKCDLFRKLGAIAGNDTIFATNTSSLSISAMAEASGRKERFVGLHFFNPALIMRLVEVISTKDLDRSILDSVKQFLSGIKKQPVFCRESPGFIVNRILLPVINEAFFNLEEKIASGMDEIEAANMIDSAVTEAGILLMGPFDLADLTGLDTINHVSDIIYEGFNRSPRYRKSPLLEQHFNNSEMGRKSGQGVYFYGNRENDPDLNPRLDREGQLLNQPTQGSYSLLDFQAVIVNEAFRVVEEGIVEDFNDIELAMELGTRWPKGPFRMCREARRETLLDHLNILYEKTRQNPRYEPSSLLIHPVGELEEYLKEK